MVPPGEGEYSSDRRLTLQWVGVSVRLASFEALAGLPGENLAYSPKFLRPC